MTALVTVAEVDPIERDRWGRPLIIQPGTGELIAYTRASTVGKAIEDTYYLSLWQQRQVLRGAHKNPLLLLELDALGDEPDRGNAAAFKAWKQALDEVVQRAHEAIGSHDRADLGTFLHAVFEADIAGQPWPTIPAQFPGYTPGMLKRDVAATSLATEGWRWLCRERFVVHDDWQVAGTLDGLTLVPREFFKPEDLPPLSDLVKWLIVCDDNKTGRSLDQAGLGYCAQVAVYTDSLLYDPQTGERQPFLSLLPTDIDPATVALNTQVAFIIHTPAGEGRCDIHTVPLDSGRAAVTMAMDVRALRTASKRWLRKVSSHQAPDATPELTAPNASLPVDRISDLIIATTSIPDLLALREREMVPVPQKVRGEMVGVVPWTDEHEALAGARAAVLKALQPVGLDLFAGIREATSTDVLLALWQEHQATWTPEHDEAAAARARVLKGIDPPY